MTKDDLLTLAFGLQCAILGWNAASWYEGVTTPIVGGVFTCLMVFVAAFTYSLRLPAVRSYLESGRSLR